MKQNDVVEFPAGTCGWEGKEGEGKSCGRPIYSTTVKG